MEHYGYVHTHSQCLCPPDTDDMFSFVLVLLQWPIITVQRVGSTRPWMERIQGERDMGMKGRREGETERFSFFGGGRRYTVNMSM